MTGLWLGGQAVDLLNQVCTQTQTHTDLIIYMYISIYIYIYIYIKHTHTHTLGLTQDVIEIIYRVSTLDSFVFIFFAVFVSVSIISGHSNHSGLGFLA